jgi:hypothetical protein
MVTLGDVWAITALIVGVAASVWALLLCLTLLFQTKTRISCDLIESGPLRYVLVGLLWTALFGTVGIALLSSPLPAVKLAGWIVTLALFGVSFLGSAGLVLLAAERLRTVDPGLSAYGALSRGAMFVVLPCILPIVGWFLFAPILFCIGVGAGLKALRYREASPVIPPAVV